MKQLLLIFLGGGAGSVARYAISRLLNPVSGFPLGTFTVNMLGSVFIGFLLGLVLKQNMFSTNTTLLLVTGFCGGFTTFSAFAYENHVMLRTGDYLGFGIYTLSSLIFGLAAVFLGIYLSRLF